MTITKNMLNALLGILGWTLANAGTLFEHVQGTIAVITSCMGIIMLAVSIRITIINFRLKKMEYWEKKRKHAELKQRLEEKDN